MLSPAEFQKLSLPQKQQFLKKTISDRKDNTGWLAGLVGFVADNEGVTEKMLNSVYIIINKKIGSLKEKKYEKSQIILHKIQSLKEEIPEEAEKILDSIYQNT